MTIEHVIIIRDKTRLEQLIERFNSKAQAKFYIERSGGNFGFYETEHNNFYQSYNQLVGLVSAKYKYKVLDRAFLVNYIFGEQDVLIVLGQDGLLANTAKYANGLPIIGINPDVTLYDGVLLKHNCSTAMNALHSITTNSYTCINVTMAKATLNDGQYLLAFNDFFIGANTHISFKYGITYGRKTENQSSSGIIVATGAGSTGWLSSVYNMANNVHNSNAIKRKVLPWDAPKLAFVVREPFLSQTSGIEVGMGSITANNKLIIESYMPSKGIVFSDGIETDFLNFNSGSILTIGIAEETACIVL